MSDSTSEWASESDIDSEYDLFDWHANSPAYNYYKETICPIINYRQ